MKQSDKTVLLKPVSQNKDALVMKKKATTNSSNDSKLYLKDLEYFRNIAEDLNLKGLNVDEGQVSDDLHDKPDQDDAKKQDSPNIFKSYSEDKNTSKMEATLPLHELSGDLRELDEQIEAMMGRGENILRVDEKRIVKAYICQVCGKQGRRSQIKDHIEGNHMENLHEKAATFNEHEISQGFRELDKQIKLMIGRGENMIRVDEIRSIKAYVCQVCGKEGRRSQIKDHIEGNHMEEICIPCPLCEKTFRNRNNLRKHSYQHR